jgi:hypothetical protein
MLGYVDPGEMLPLGAVSLDHVTIKTALAPPIRKYPPRVMQLIADGRLDPKPLLSHVLPLEQAPRAYQLMSERRDGAIKINVEALNFILVMRPVVRAQLFQARNLFRSNYPSIGALRVSRTPPLPPSMRHS